MIKKQLLLKAAFFASLMTKSLNIAAFLPHSNVNGPGSRFVLWLQGCSHGCARCFNAAMQAPKKATLLSIPSVYSLIIKNRKYIEGVTYTGGEPFDQAAGLFQLTKMLKHDGLSVMSYTGYTLEELRRSRAGSKLKLLKELDLLIDGPFLYEAGACNGWRGSANQQCHVFDANLRPENNDSENAMEIIINEQGDIALTGFFPGDVQNTIAKVMGGR